MLNNSIDLKLRLLSGLPFDIEGAGTIHPLTLKQIADIGYSQYLQYVYLTTLDASKLMDVTSVEELEGVQLNGFDLIVNSGNDKLISDFTSAVKLLFKVEDVTFSLSYQKIFIGSFDKGSNTPNLNRDNYLALKDIVEYQNGMKNVDESQEFNPSDDAKAKEMAEKLKKGRELVKKAKSGEDSDDAKIDLFDIISSVSSKAHNLNKMAIWDLTLYQLYDEYRRLEAIDQYDMTIQSLLHGADSKKIEIKHWSSKIDK